MRDTSNKKNRFNESMTLAEQSVMLQKTQVILLALILFLMLFI